MSKQIQIIDYFDSLVDEVDIKAEKLLAFYSSRIYQEPLNEQDKLLHSLIKQRRSSFIETIEQLKAHNLECLNKKAGKNRQPADDEKVTLFDKYCLIVDEYDMDIEIAYLISNKVKKSYHETNIIKSFGYLIVLDDGCPSERALALFREILKYGHFDQDYFGNLAESDFEHAEKFYKQLDRSMSYKIESNLFDTNLMHALKYVAVKFKVLSNAGDDFIIKTTQNDLFQVESIFFHQSRFLFTIKQEAIKLFFKHPIDIIIHENREEAEEKVDVHRIKNSLKWLESNLKVQDIYLKINNANQINLNDLSEIKSIRTVLMNIRDKEINLNGQLPKLQTLQVTSLKYFKTSKHIEKNAFLNLIALTELNLSKNSIQTIDSSAFNRLVNLKNLNLSKNELESINRSHFKRLSNLIDLNLSYNNINSIDDEAFAKLRNLKTLNLCKIKLTSISELLFDGLANLLMLQISSDRLLTIHPNAFASLSKLEFMTLGAELVKSLDDQLFVNLANLKRLHLNKNFIRDFSFKFRSIENLHCLDELHVNSIDIAPLRHIELNAVTQLKIIKFSGNQIKSLKGNVFHELADLNKLTLENNTLTSVKSQTFNGLRNLTYLKLSNNQIKRIDPGTFDDLLNLETLILRQNQICSIDAKLCDKLVKLNRLDLSSNKLSRINSNTFARLTNLEKLDISRNNIKQIEENAFYGLFNLRKFILRDNKLVTLAPNVFVHLNKVIYLNLSRNMLKSLDSSSFAGLKSLEILYLKGNKLPRVESAFKQIAANLTDLNMSSNEIDEIEPDAFSGMKKLECLNLSHNRLTELGANKFVSLRNLAGLNLRSNKIERLNEHDFNGLRNLRFLRLDNNQISQIHCNVFHPTVNLYRLYLSRNKITDIEGFFSGEILPKLMYVTLENNQLTRIQSGTFDSLVNVQWLLLNNNKIQIIEANSFDRLKHLATLDLTWNSLNQNDFSPFKQLEMLEYLFIGSLVLEENFNNEHLLDDLKYLHKNYIYQFNFYDNDKIDYDDEETDYDLEDNKPSEDENNDQNDESDDSLSETKMEH